METRAKQVRLRERTDRGSEVGEIFVAGDVPALGVRRKAVARQEPAATPCSSHQRPLRCCEDGQCEYGHEMARAWFNDGRRQELRAKLCQALARHLALQSVP